MESTHWIKRRKLNKYTRDERESIMVVSVESPKHDAEDWFAIPEIRTVRIPGPALKRMKVELSS